MGAIAAASCFIPSSFFMCCLRSTSCLTEPGPVLSSFLISSFTGLCFLGGRRRWAFLVVRHPLVLLVLLLLILLPATVLHKRIEDTVAKGRNEARVSEAGAAITKHSRHPTALAFRVRTRAPKEFVQNRLETGAPPSLLALALDVHAVEEYVMCVRWCGGGPPSLPPTHPPTHPDVPSTPTHPPPPRTRIWLLHGPLGCARSGGVGPLGPRVHWMRCWPWPPPSSTPQQSWRTLGHIFPWPRPCGPVDGWWVVGGWAHQGVGACAYVACFC